MLGGKRCSARCLLVRAQAMRLARRKPHAPETCSNHGTAMWTWNIESIFEDKITHLLTHWHIFIFILLHRLSIAITLQQSLERA